MRFPLQPRSHYSEHPFGIIAACRITCHRIKDVESNHALQLNVMLFYSSGTKDRNVKHILTFREKIFGNLYNGRIGSGVFAYFLHRFHACERASSLREKNHRTTELQVGYSDKVPQFYLQFILDTCRTDERTVRISNAYRN